MDDELMSAIRRLKSMLPDIFNEGSRSERFVQLKQLQSHFEKIAKTQRDIQAEAKTIEELALKQVEFIKPFQNVLQDLLDQNFRVSNEPTLMIQREPRKMAVQDDLVDLIHEEIQIKEEPNQYARHQDILQEFSPEFSPEFSQEFSPEINEIQLVEHNEEAEEVEEIKKQASRRKTRSKTRRLREDRDRDSELGRKPRRVNYQMQDEFIEPVSQPCPEAQESDEAYEEKEPDESECSDGVVKGPAKKKKKKANLFEGKIAAKMTRQGQSVFEIPDCLKCISCRRSRVNSLVQKKDKNEPKKVPPTDMQIHDVYVSLASSVSTSAFYDPKIRNFFTCGQCRAAPIQSAQIALLKENYEAFCDLCKIDIDEDVLNRLIESSAKNGQTTCNQEKRGADECEEADEADGEQHNETKDFDNPDILSDPLLVEKIQNVLMQMGSHKFVSTHMAATREVIRPNDPSVDAPSETQPLIQGDGYIIGFEWKREKDWNDQDHIFWLCFYQSEPGSADAQWIRFDENVLSLNPKKRARTQNAFNDLVELTHAFIQKDESLF